MTTFEHWDKVISVTAKDTSLEALVDFEDQNWNVYISERWKTLSNPMRIVLEKKYLVKKDNKVELTKAQFQSLIYEYYPEPINVDDIWKELQIRKGLIISNIWYNWAYVDKFDDEGNYIFCRKIDNWTWKSSVNDFIYMRFNESDLKRDVVKLEDVLQYIFGNAEVSDFNIIIKDDDNKEIVNLAPTN